MTYFDQSTHGHGQTSAFGAAVAKVGAMFSALADSWRRARIFRETYAELDRMSTRELDDMGLTRSMLTRVAFEAAYGPKA